MIAHERHLSLSFYLPPSVGLLLTIWTRLSVRVIAHERHISLSFYLPPSVSLLLTTWTRFSVRVYDRAWEASFALFLSTAERRLTADHLDKIFCTRLRSRMGGIFRSFFIYRRASAYDRLHISTTTIHKKDPKLKQYRTAITPLASKQYSTYAVTIDPFPCLPREAPFLREIRALRQVAHKQHRCIYTMVFCVPRQHGSDNIF